MIHKSSFDAFLLHYGLKKECVFEVHDGKRLLLDSSGDYIYLCILFPAWLFDKLAMQTITKIPLIINISLNLIISNFN